MTKQEYYDLLVNTSAEGGFPAVGASISGGIEVAYCRYRTKDGKKCAVGVIIPDEIYKPTIETFGADTIVTDIGDDWVPEGISLKDLILIQSTHDVLAREQWRHEEFVFRLNSLECFADVVKK